MKSPAPTKRARSDQQKHKRRADILAAAAEHLVDVGFERFSMGKLAQHLAFSKGTLYLYFKTREEVLLALFDVQFSIWAADLEQILTPKPSDEDFCRAFLQTAQKQQALIPLLLQLSAVIEHNVSVNALIKSKRLMRDRIDQLAKTMSTSLKLSEAQSQDLLVSLAPLMVGTVQHDLAPSLQRTPLPSDVRAFIDSFTTEQLFTLNAQRILRSIRAGT